MTASHRKSLGWRTAVVVPVLLAGIVMLQTRIDAQQGGLTKQHEELLVQSGPLLKKLSLGYDSLLGDVYWTRTVQYFGAKLPTADRDFSLLAPLLDVATTLDPNLTIAYHYGSFFLSEKQGGAANPEDWRLPADLGFLYYVRLKDYEKASAAYLQTSNVPGAPSFFKILAARVAAKGGAIDTSRMIWSELYESAQDPDVKKRALEELTALKVQSDEMQLDKLAEDYHARFGSYPITMLDLITAGLIAGAPVDPAGFPYVFGPDGKSQLDPKSTVALPPAPR
jgi:hypothetical protein